MSDWFDQVLFFERATWATVRTQRAHRVNEEKDERGRGKGRWEGGCVSWMIHCPPSYQLAPTRRARDIEGRWDGMGWGDRVEKDVGEVCLCG